MKPNCLNIMLKLNKLIVNIVLDDIINKLGSETG